MVDQALAKLKGYMNVKSIRAQVAKYWRLLTSIKNIWCFQAAIPLSLIFFSAQAQAPLDVRVALVIGNSAYTQVESLDNAGNDAKAIGQALKTLGFIVVHLQDATLKEMNLAIEDVGRKLSGKQALGMLYYAGHGLQLDWQNFMLPVDVGLNYSRDLQNKSINVTRIVDLFKNAGTRMNIIVLDACRNNPFALRTGFSKGLAPMDAPPGTLLAYSTQPGNVAEDGDYGSGNGPYALFLQTELHRPFARVEDVFKRVRLQVRQKTEGRQIPWESTSLEEDFVFNDGVRGTIKSVDLERLASETRKKEQDIRQHYLLVRDREKKIEEELENEKKYREEIAKKAEQQRIADDAKRKEADRLSLEAREKERKKIQQEAQKADEAREAMVAQIKIREQVLEQERMKEKDKQRLLDQSLFLNKKLAERQKFIAETFASEKARNEALSSIPQKDVNHKKFMEEKTEWDRILLSNNSADIYNYLDKFPSGSISELAAAKLEQLDVPKVEPVADQNGLVQPFKSIRFRMGDSYKYLVRDLLTSNEIERPKFTVVKTDESFAEFDQGYLVTHSGAIVRTISSATLDPYQQWLPAGAYQIGKKWRTRSIMTLRNGEKMWVEMTGQVVSREKVTVPAGVFETYKMVMEQTAQDGTRLKVTYWGQPDWGLAVKQIREVRNSRGSLSGQIYEMISRNRG